MELAASNDETLALIRSSVGAITEQGGGIRRVRALQFKRPGFSPEIWREMCALGWPALLLSEAKGGTALGMPALCALLEQLGRALVPEPLYQSSITAPYLPEPQLADLLTGDAVFLLALQESPNDLERPPQTRLAAGRLNGRKTFVPMAAGATGFLVSTADGLALVERNAAGVELDVLETQDGGHFGTVTFRNAPAIPIAGDAGAVADAATIAVSSYLLGVMEGALDITVAYLRTRVQFGRPIGAFQALQHKAAEMKIHATIARASIEAAAVTLDSDAPADQRSAAVSRAKVRAAEASLHITKDAIQLHGAIGYTDEHDIGLFLKKALTLCNLYGSATAHRTRFIKLAPEDDDD